jgi:hypothetical protein
MVALIKFDVRRATKYRSKSSTQRCHGHHLFHRSDHIMLLVDGVDMANEP